MLEVNTMLIASDPADPTHLRLTLDGVELFDFRKWTYDPTSLPSYFQPADPGATVTLTITPEYATGPWIVELVDRCGADRCPVLDP